MDRRLTYILYITFIPPVVCTDPGSYKLIIRTKCKRTNDAKNARYTNEMKRTNYTENANERYTKGTNDTRSERTIHERTNYCRCYTCRWFLVYFSV